MCSRARSYSEKVFPCTADHDAVQGSEFIHGKRSFCHTLHVSQECMTAMLVLMLAAAILRSISLCRTGPISQTVPFFESKPLLSLSLPLYVCLSLRLSLSLCLCLFLLFVPVLSSCALFISVFLSLFLGLSLSPHPLSLPHGPHPHIGLFCFLCLLCAAVLGLVATCSWPTINRDMQHHLEQLVVSRIDADVSGATYALSHSFKLTWAAVMLMLAVIAIEAHSICMLASPLRHMKLLVRPQERWRQNKTE